MNFQIRHSEYGSKMRYITQDVFFGIILFLGWDYPDEHAQFIENTVLETTVAVFKVKWK